MRYVVYLRFSPRRSAKRASPLCSRWQRRFARPRPRASATRDREPEAGCMKSATAGTAGRRRFRRGVAMPATCSSTTAGSIRRIAATVRTVFSCVASRNRVPSGTRRLVLTRPSSSAPNFLCRARPPAPPKSTDEPKRSRVNYFGSRSAVVTFWPVGRWNRRSPNSGRQPITCSVTERFTVSKTYSFSVFFVKA